jgi:hypothetical protein
MTLDHFPLRNAKLPRKSFRASSRPVPAGRSRHDEHHRISENLDTPTWQGSSRIPGPYNPSARGSPAWRDADCLPRLSCGGQAEPGEARFQQGEGAPGGIGPAEPGLDVHDLLVEGLVVRIVGQRGFQGGQGLLGVARLEDVGDAGQGVEGAAAGRLGVAFGPLVSRSVGQRPLVERDGLPQGGELVLVAGGRQLARHGALLRRLRAGETLGAVTTLVTDKTGTLTENRLGLASITGDAGAGGGPGELGFHRLAAGRALRLAGHRRGQQSPAVVPAMISAVSPGSGMPRLSAATSANSAQ